jgi:hypothetical protein
LARNYRWILKSLGELQGRLGAEQIQAEVVESLEQVATV